MIRVLPGRSNSTNICFSKWVKIHGTVPECTDTVEIMKAFLRRSCSIYSGVADRFAAPCIRAMAAWTTSAGQCGPHIKDKKMGRMMTAHIRGASASKFVQLVPDLTEQALIGIRTMDDI